MSSQPTEVVDIETAFRRARVMSGGKPKLVVGYQHDTSVRELNFILSIPLPREYEGRYFLYKGNQIHERAQIENPKVALCDNPRIRAFMNSLSNELQLDVVRLSLNQVAIRYRNGPVGKDETVRIFGLACARAYGFEDGVPILIAPLEPSPQ